MNYLRNIIIVHINNKNPVINNNYGRFQDLILLFKILTGTRKIFFEIYRQFGFAPSKRFAIPGLSDTKGLSKIYVYRDRNSLNLLSVLFYFDPVLQQRRFFRKKYFLYSASTHVLEG